MPENQDDQHGIDQKEIIDVLEEIKKGKYDKPWYHRVDNWVHICGLILTILCFVWYMSQLDARVKSNTDSIQHNQKLIQSDRRLTEIKVKESEQEIRSDIRRLGDKIDAVIFNQLEQSKITE